jgi:hypothetical protein
VGLRELVKRTNLKPKFEYSKIITIESNEVLYKLPNRSKSGGEVHYGGGKYLGGQYTPGSGLQFGRGAQNTVFSVPTTTTSGAAVYNSNISRLGIGTAVILEGGAIFYSSNDVDGNGRNDYLDKYMKKDEKK